MDKKTEALKLAQDLRVLADRFSEGWHDGIKIDASDILLLSDAAEALAEQQPAQQQEPVAWKPTEADYKKWCERHGMQAPTARDAFDDAASLYHTASPEPAQQQDGEAITQTFTGLPKRKLNELLSAGWQINGVCFQRTEEDGSVRRGAATTGGMVLWWNQPSQQQEPVAHCRVRPLRGDQSFPTVEVDWVSEPVPGPLYTSPQPRREWAGLTDEDKLAIRRLTWETPEDLIDNTEAKLRGKNA